VRAGVCWQCRARRVGICFLLCWPLHSKERDAAALSYPAAVRPAADETGWPQLYLSMVGLDAPHLRGTACRSRAVLRGPDMNTGSGRTLGTGVLIPLGPQWN